MTVPTAPLTLSLSKGRASHQGQTIFLHPAQLLCSRRLFHTVDFVPLAAARSHNADSLSRMHFINLRHRTNGPAQLRQRRTKKSWLAANE